MPLALTLVVLLLSVILLIKNKGQALTDWALLCLALASLWPLQHLFG